MNNSKGMTLLEVILALLIFVIAAAMMVSGIITVMNISNRATEQIRTTSNLNLNADTDIVSNETVGFTVIFDEDEENPVIGGITVQKSVSAVGGGIRYSYNVGVEVGVADDYE